MTVNELILLDKAKVRRDSNLMHLYLEFFKEAFGRVPNCAGCSFGADWQKLVLKYSKKSVTLQKGNPMKTIQIKKIQGKILTYRKDGKTFRQYDNILTDAFIKEYVSNGTEEENKERVKMFNFPVENASENPLIQKVILALKDGEELNIESTEGIKVTEVVKETTHVVAKKRSPKKRK